jgi:membrane-associated phospholipid phosphatase
VRNKLRERLAESSAIVVAGFVCVVVFLYAFAWLADQVLEQETQALDLAALAFLRQFSSPELTLAAQAVSLLGAEAIWGIAAVLLAWFIWRHRWTTAVTLALVAGGAQILNDFLKALFQRARPEPVVSFIAAQGFSFPSGHAMVSAAFYLYLAYLTWRFVHGWWRGVLIVGLLLLVLLIGLSRLYLEVHYLSDVIAGYLAGFLWTDAVILANQALTARSRSRPLPSPRTA